mgnify:CR=1 FL=1
MPGREGVTLGPANDPPRDPPKLGLRTVFVRDGFVLGRLKPPDRELAVDERPEVLLGRSTVDTRDRPP